jgi:hypothetical protein
LFEFLFELYNFIGIAREASGYLREGEPAITKLQRVARNHYKTAFTSKRKRGATSQREESQGRGAEQSREVRGRRQLQHAEEIYDAREVASTLANAGYELQSNSSDDDNWEPLNQVCH